MTDGAAYCLLFSRYRRGGLAERSRVPAVSAETYYLHSKAEAENRSLGQQQKLGEKVWDTFARLIEVLYE
jgi:hypothetical protein